MLDAALLAVLSPLWKAAATALVIVATGRIARSAGPVLTSVAMSLPVNAAPGFFFVSLALDEAFVAEGALHALAAAGAVLIYLGTFARVARFGSFPLALLAGLAAWSLAAWPILGMELDFWRALACVAAGAGFAALVGRRSAGPGAAVSAPASWRYLLGRAAVAGAAIAAIATAAPFIGPALAGLLLSFPITLSTTGWALSGHYGLDFVAAAFASARKAMSLYVLFCAILLGLLEVRALDGPLAVVAAFAAVAALGAVFALAYSRLRARARR